MKKLLLTIVCIFCIFPVLASAQSLVMGAVVFELPVRGAFEFALMAGEYQDQNQSLLNGFHYGQGEFHLWKNGGPGVCLDSSDPNVPGCRFDGTMGKVTTTPLDEYCSEISFPVNGELQLLTGVGVLDYVDAGGLYSQTFCNINGSMFMSGGSLVIRSMRDSDFSAP
ncbi:MAG: hypothetical protein ACHP9V_03720 [Terriglobales bacterium]